MEQPYMLPILSIPCLLTPWQLEEPGGCFTNVSRALQNNLVKIHNTRNHIYGENFKLKLRTCAQSMALGACTKFQLENLITSTISAIHKFRENILESSRKVSETTPRASTGMVQWNLCNETGTVSLKTHKFHHLPGMVFTKSCVLSLSWKTTCLERPQTLVLSLYRFHCID